MLAQERFRQLQDFINGYSREELIWINGYLSGLVNGSNETKINAATETTRKKITVAFGTETGNAKSLAMQLGAVARQKSVVAKIAGLDQYKLSDLEKEEFLILIISTQGEGEPPIPAKKFYDYIHAQQLQLPQLNYAVLALGDSSYPLFCKTGEDVDSRFKAFGAKAILPLRKCDTDYEADAKAWFEELLTALQQSSVAATAQKPQAAAMPKAAGKKYYNSRIATNINLNDVGSNKQTFHIELSTDEPVEYEPGDTIGIVPHNRKEVVQRIIEITGINPDIEIQTAKVKAGVRELLTRHLNICYLLSSTIKKYAALTNQEIPDIRMDLVDLLRIYPVKDAEQFEEVIKLLLSIAPRLYSVASSPEAHGNYEVHITVAKDRFIDTEGPRYGLCSEFLGELEPGAEISFYVHKDKHFKLPAQDRDIIMIGPGTGVAPFRSFLAHRDATGASGRNWFFFGEQHFVKDFLYQTEIQNFLATGVLHKLDLAFSRDQSNKIYVQHKMMEHAAELYQWIDAGAAVYISGTKDPMSKDVEACLLNIISTYGKKSPEEAMKLLEHMRKEGRYGKDVY